MREGGRRRGREGGREGWEGREGGRGGREGREGWMGREGRGGREGREGREGGREGGARAKLGFPPSLQPSSPPSLFARAPPSLFARAPPSLPPSLPRCLVPSLPRSLPRSLPPSRSSGSLTPSSPPSLPLNSLILKKNLHNVFTSLLSGVVPAAMKHAIVTPIIKKRGIDVNLHRNYRPISSMSVVSKTLERYVALELRRYLDVKCLNDPFHHM